MMDIEKKISEINKKSLEAIKGLTPKTFWKRFYEISRIPRESGNELKIREYILKFSKEKNLETKTDTLGNVIVKLPASPEFSKKNPKKTPLILQAHLDMVCEKEKTKIFDFKKFPIEIVRKGDWISSDKTTLGADNGVGIATILAIVDDEKNFSHGAIECLFTVEEETGLGGAKKVNTTFLEGKSLLNIDSEDWGEIFMGCAGGGSSSFVIPIQEENCEFEKSGVIEIDGLNGGHSGCDIHFERGNAVKIVGMCLNEFWKENIKFSVSKIEIESKYNAIPREGVVNLNFNDKDFGKIDQILNEVNRKLLHVYKSVDPGVKIGFKKVDEKNKMQWKKEFTEKIVDLFYVIPHGVLRMSHDIKDLANVVETSNNLACCYEIKEEMKKDLIKKFTNPKIEQLLKNKIFLIGTMYRSLVNERVEDVRRRINSIGKLANCFVLNNEYYSGWKPNPKSKILEISKKTYKRLYGKEPIIKVIHAGLECGILKERFKKEKNYDIDCVSFGPDIRNAHTPREKADIISIKKNFEFTKEIIKDFFNS